MGRDGVQAVVWQTAVNPVVALELLASAHGRERACSGPRRSTRSRSSTCWPITARRMRRRARSRESLALRRVDPWHAHEEGRPARHAEAIPCKGPAHLRRDARLAEEQYDSEARAHQTAWSAVKHSFEKVGDHWEAKDERGPSDPQSKQSSAAKRDRPKATHGGVDVEGNTKQQLYERARKAGVDGRSRMTKARAGRRDRPQAGLSSSSANRASQRAPISAGR